MGSLYRRIASPAWIAVILGLIAVHGETRAQGRRNQAPPPAPANARTAAPFDMTGYWVALITDDWRYRMLTPPKGNVDYVPVNAEGRRVTEAWDPAKDEAAGDPCKAYGAAGIMRLPGRLHITWENDSTLHIDIDTGTQTRRFFFGADLARPAQSSWQGFSVARWELPRGRGAGGQSGYGQLTVTTTGMRPGYLRKNGVPYSADAVLTEHFVRLIDKGGQHYLALTSIVEDPQYLQQPYIKTYLYKKQADNAGWTPTSCSAR